MDIFDSRYFIINKVLMQTFGLWYDQTRFKKYLTQGAIVLSIFTITVPHIYGLHNCTTKDSKKILVHITVLLYFSAIITKFITTALAEKQLTAVFKSIGANWQSLKNQNEIAIIREYSESGRFVTLLYIGYMHSALVFYVSMPLSPMLFDMLFPLNESRRLLYITYGDYPCDHEKNYAKIFLFELTVCTISVFVFCTVDSTYAACIEQCLGFFTIIKSRLHLATKYVKGGKDSFDSKQEDTAYNLIVETVKLHKRIIAFAENLEEAYSTSFLLLLGLNGLYVSVICVLILNIRDDFMERSRYISILVGVMLHLFYVNWPGQKLIDYSSAIYEDAYMNEWYDSSIKAQNLLRFMTLRCLRPCQMTAGGILTMGFQNFAVIAKTSMSYIAVFASFA